MIDQDAELLARIRNGATDEFSELVQRHQSQVFAILYRYERDRHTLEDLAQETYLKAWRSLSKFDGRAPFAHWLSRIAVNVALDHLRKIRRQKNEVSLAELGDEALDWLRNPDERQELDSPQAAELLAVAMRELSPAEQVVLTLQELEGHSIKEICARTGSSSVAVRVRAMRARKKLRTALQRMAGEVK